MQLIAYCADIQDLLTHQACCRSTLCKAYIPDIFGLVVLEYEILSTTTKTTINLVVARELQRCSLVVGSKDIGCWEGQGIGNCRALEGYTLLGSQRLVCELNLGLDNNLGIRIVEEIDRHDSVTILILDIYIGLVAYTLGEYRCAALVVHLQAEHTVRLGITLVVGDISLECANSEPLRLLAYCNKLAIGTLCIYNIVVELIEVVSNNIVAILSLRSVQIAHAILIWNIYKWSVSRVSACDKSCQNILEALRSGTIYINLVRGDWNGEFNDALGVLAQGHIHIEGDILGIAHNALTHIYGDGVLASLAIELGIGAGVTILVGVGKGCIYSRLCRKRHCPSLIGCESYIIRFARLYCNLLQLGESWLYLLISAFDRSTRSEHHRHNAQYCKYLFHSFFLAFSYWPLAYYNSQFSILHL